MNDRICPQEDILSEYLSGCLREDKRIMVETHLAACKDCRELLVDTCEITKKLKSSEFGKVLREWGIKNRWLIGALIAFFSSFFFPKYFLQFLVACLLMGGKWIIEAKTTKMLIMIHEAWKRGDKKTTDKIFSHFSASDKKRI